MNQSKAYESTSLIDILVTLRREAIADLMLGRLLRCDEDCVLSEKSSEFVKFIVVVVYAWPALLIDCAFLWGGCLCFA